MDDSGGNHQILGIGSGTAVKEEVSNSSEIVGTSFESFDTTSGDIVIKEEVDDGDLSSSSLSLNINDEAGERIYIEAFDPRLLKESVINVTTIVKSEVPDQFEADDLVDAPTSEGSQNEFVGRKYRCSSCAYEIDEVFSSILEKADLNIEDIKCNRCKDEATSSLNSRFKENAPRLVRIQFKCSDCSFRAPQKKHIAQHRKVAHPRVKNFKCDQCSFKAYTKHDLEPHITAVPLEIKGFDCDQCGFRTSTEKRLAKHVVNIHLRIRNFGCNYCSSKFLNKSALNSHVNVVHLKIPYKCNLCGYKTRDSQALSKHEEAVHMGSNIEKEFECIQCGYQVAEKRDLKQHMEVAHWNVKGFSCLRWYLKTTTQTNLVNHNKNAHSGVNELDSNQYSYEADRKSVVGSHLKTVPLKFKKYRCSLCSHRTSLRHKLQEHIKSVHLKRDCGEKKVEVPIFILKKEGRKGAVKFAELLKPVEVDEIEEKIENKVITGHSSLEAVKICSQINTKELRPELPKPNKLKAMTTCTQTGDGHAAGIIVYPSEHYETAPSASPVEPEKASNKATFTKGTVTEETCMPSSSSTTTHTPVNEIGKEKSKEASITNLGKTKSDVGLAKRDSFHKKYIMLKYLQS